MIEVKEKTVLDEGFVRLVDHMGDDDAIVRAARVSYGDGTKTKRDDRSLIHYLMRNRHTSPFEMVEFVFHVKAPIFVTRQWFRHRTASYNEISGRYSILKDSFYHPQWRRQSKKNKQGGDGLFDEYTSAYLDDAYSELQEEIRDIYQRFLAAGVERGQARMVLSLSTYTEFYFKQDLHNLLHFIKLRMDYHAQQEIREYARAILQLITPIVPVTIEAWYEYVWGAVTFTSKEWAAIKSLLPKNALQLLVERAGIDSKTRIEELRRHLEQA